MRSTKPRVCLILVMMIALFLASCAPFSPVNIWVPDWKRLRVIWRSRTGNELPGSERVVYVAEFRRRITKEEDRNYIFLSFWQTEDEDYAERKWSKVETSQEQITTVQEIKVSYVIRPNSGFPKMDAKWRISNRYFGLDAHFLIESGPDVINPNDALLKKEVLRFVEFAVEQTENELK